MFDFFVDGCTLQRMREKREGEREREGEVK
jgi:hypothetical protein